MVGIKRADWEMKNKKGFLWSPGGQDGDGDGVAEEADAADDAEEDSFAPVLARVPERQVLLAHCAAVGSRTRGAPVVRQVAGIHVR